MFHSLRSFICIITVFSYVSATGQSQKSLLQTIRQNYIQSLIPTGKESSALIDQLSSISPEKEISDQAVVELHQRYPFDLNKIEAYIQQMQPDGSWPDINYSDTKRSGWEPKQHAERVLELTKLYNSPDNSYYRSPQIAGVIHQALGYWFRTKPRCLNWWYNQIGLPKTYGPAFLLFEKEMTAEEKTEAIQLMQEARFGMTGQNKVWLAGNVLIRALLQNDETLVKAARDTIASELTTGRTEGLKSDWSFHQHGPQQQFGNYGLSYLMEMSFFSGLFAGTSLAFPEQQQALLTNYLAEGYRWVVWRGKLDINALDRQLFHNAPIHKAFSTAFAAQSLLKGSSPEQATPIRAYLSDNFPPQPSGSSFTGHKHFWDSDQTIHRSGDWMASVKMASNRVIGTELVNEDNLKGYYMADGATYIYQRGDEYLNIFPLWDWRKIPGTTSYDTRQPVPTQYGPQSRNRTDFVGGITDGIYGMTAMDFNRDGLKARKAWVFTPESVIALGADIRSDSSLLVSTTIDQRLQRDSLLTLPTTESQRFYHDSTGYILLQNADCRATVTHRSGQWRDFMGMYAPKTVEGDIVTLSIYHGVKPYNASYQYLILPATTREKTISFRTSETQIIRNDKQIQAVTLKIPSSGKTYYFITAYQPDKIRFNKDFLFEALTPGMYLVRQEGSSVQIYASDPTHQQASLSIRLNQRRITFTPSSGYNPGEVLFQKVRWK